MQQTVCASGGGNDLSVMFLLKSAFGLSWAGTVKEEQEDIRTI